jgi:hypothetical protein
MNRIESFQVLNKIAQAYGAKAEIENANLATYTLPVSEEGEFAQVLANCFYLEAINHGAVNTDEIETRGNQVLVTFKGKEIAPTSPNFENSAIAQLCRDFNRRG